MKTPYFVFNDLHIACIPKAGSSAIARAIHFALHPDYKVISASGNAEMVERVIHNPGWQALAPKTFDPVNPVIPLRNPVERFRSACAQEGLTADEAIALIEAGKSSGHFRAQSDYLVPGQNALYRFPEHIEELAALLGLDEIPEVNTSATNNGPKPDLTPEQVARVESLYVDDIALYESISEPGQVLAIAPPGPEPEPVPAEAPRWAVRAALKIMGWFDQVEAVIYGMPDGPDKIAAVEVWEEGNYFVLESPTINAIMQALGKTQEERDDLFRLAATLKP